VEPFASGHEHRIKVRVAGLPVGPLTLGLQGQRLVRSMASQIGGLLEIKPDAGEPGTVATVRFPVKAEA